LYPDQPGYEPPAARKALRSNARPLSRRNPDTAPIVAERIAPAPSLDATSSGKSDISPSLPDFPGMPTVEFDVWRKAVMKETMRRHRAKLAKIKAGKAKP
jgi:hypothetical protein